MSTMEKLRRETKSVENQSSIVLGQGESTDGGLSEILSKLTVLKKLNLHSNPPEK